jgi:hypothetical protein
MPRYFFHMVDGTRDEDPRGTELADDKAAFREAVRFAGLALASEPELLLDHLRFRVEVTDEADELVFVLSTSADRKRAAEWPADAA